MIQAFTSLVLFFLLSGCATDIDYKIPAHRFMDPEVRGSNLFQSEISAFTQVSFQSDHKLTMTEVYDFGVFNSETIDDSQALERTGNFGLQAGLGLHSKVDFILRENGDSPTMGVIKFQALGEGAIKSELGHKMSFWAGVGSMDEDEGSLTVTENSSGTTRTYSGEIKVTPWEAGLSYGYRFSDLFLAYINGVYGSYKSESLLTSSSLNDVRVEGKAKLYAFSLGLKIGQHQGLACHIEAGASRVEWDEPISIEQELGTFGLSLSLGF